jgi:Flp pilus assembly pilin Flp
MFRKMKTKGQSTVEYILLATAVVAVLILFTTNPNTGLRAKLNSTLTSATDTIGDMGNRLKNSQAPTP